jgi:LysR family transcriptional activator of nhaA
MQLNYHHLRYFWAVAKEGSLTRAATRLHVSQSALSTQIRQLEQVVGHPLFLRASRSMRLTEAGQLALGYAETIFTAGDELLEVLQGGARRERQVLRIGAVATLSRNFQENFLRPLLDRDDVELVLQSGSSHELLTRLRVHTLDLVLTNRRVQPTADDPWRCRRIARQPVSLVGKPRPPHRRFRFPDELAEVPLLLPSPDNDLRAGFDLMCKEAGLRCTVRAEVDDMALLRLLARDTDAVALVPTVVVQDELRSGRLEEYRVVPELFETFYGLTVPRRFAPAALRSLLERPEADMLRLDGSGDPDRDPEH